MRMKKNHVAAIIAATKIASTRMRRQEPMNFTLRLTDLPPKKQRAESEEQNRHHN